MKLTRHTRTPLRLAACLLVLAIAAPARSDDPLRVADVIRFLRAGISERTILTEIRERSVRESLDASGEAALRDAGATDLIVDAFRAAAPKPAPPPPAELPSPPGAFPPGASATRSGQTPVFGVSTRAVRLPVSVTDKQGRPVTDLKQQDFQVQEEGRPQQITIFSGERKPLRIAVALDVSGSMADKIEEVADALKHFLELLEPDDQVLVMTFSDRPELVQDFTSERQRLGRLIARLQPAGGTSLHDAVIEAIERVAPASAESKAVVLVTDGMDTSSAASFRDAREAARRSEVPVYSIGIGHQSGFAGFLGRLGGIRVGPRRGGHGGHGASNVQDFDPRPLLELAEETGARAEILKDLEHHHTGKVDRLKEAAESIALALRYRYLLAYEQPEATGRDRWKEIRVKVNRPGVQVRARKGYYSSP